MYKLNHFKVANNDFKQESIFFAVYKAEELVKHVNKKCFFSFTDVSKRFYDLNFNKDIISLLKA